MAQEAPKSGWGLWSFVETVTSTVKQKSDEIINIYKEDLQEFSKTIVNDTSTVIKENVVDKLATLNLTEEKRKERERKRAAQRVNPAQARIQRTQRDSKTYTEIPSDEAFEAWANSFNVGSPENTESITHLLTSNEAVREFHTALVPAKVAYRDFWCRYYFRIHKLEEEEKRRTAILNSAITNDDEELSWDVEDDTARPPTPPSSTSPPKPSPDSLTPTPSSPTPSSPVPSFPTPSSPSPSSSPPSASSPRSTSLTPVPSSPPPAPLASSPAPSPTSPIPPSTPPPTPASAHDTVETPVPLATEESVPTSPAVAAPSPSPPKKEINSDEFEDDIEEEIAKKYTESQQKEKEGDKSELSKSDVEDGWADWE